VLMVFLKLLNSSYGVSLGDGTPNLTALRTLSLLPIFF
jgi:hypothetical protein